MEKRINNERAFKEMLIILALMIVTALFLKDLMGIVAFLPIIYFLIERRVRNRTLVEIGFNRKDLLKDLRRSWLLVILVGIIFQIIYFTMFVNLSPEIFEQIRDRTSFITTFDGKLIFSLLVLALGEEIVFRGLIQGRLQWKLNPVYSIIITSFFFAIMHISDGSLPFVALDLSTYL